ncbi:MAG: hypothetical protein ABSD72_08990 [Terracidiphilus sp.]
MKMLAVKLFILVALGGAYLCANAVPYCGQPHCIWNWTLHMCVCP